MIVASHLSPPAFWLVLVCIVLVFTICQALVLAAENRSYDRRKPQCPATLDRYQCHRQEGHDFLNHVHWVTNVTKVSWPL